VLALGCGFAGSAWASLPPSERTALNQFFSLLDGKHWLRSAGWTGSRSDACTWFGVRCTSDHKHVAGLRLPGNRLRGSLQSLTKFSALTHLSQLELWNSSGIPADEWNQLSGALPPQFASLKQLSYVDLRLNTISDRLDVFAGFSQLAHLALDDNEFFGSIPPSLGSLRNLQVLTLSDNELTGDIPTELGQLEHLTKLWLYNNTLAGDIPASLGNLSALTELRLGGNPLTGEIPPTLGQLGSLQRLELGLASLSGHLPPELAKLGQLQVLNLGTNLLTGNPRSIDWSGLGNLQELYLDTNLFHGTLPAVFPALPKLRILRLRANGFVGDVSDAYLSFALRASELDLRWNALDPSPATTRQLDALSNGEFSSTQTIVPRDVVATGTVTQTIGGMLQGAHVFARWTPIAYVQGDGGYNIQIFFGNRPTLKEFVPVIGKQTGLLTLDETFPIELPCELPCPITLSVSSFTEPSGFNPGSVASATGPFVGAPPAQEASGQVAFDQGDYVVAEGDVLTAQVLRVGGFAGTLTATITAVPGTATSDDFLSPQPENLTWADTDDSSRTVTLATVAGVSTQTTKTLSIVASAGGRSASATVEIGPRVVAGTAADPVIATNGLGRSFAAWTQTQTGSRLRDVMGRFLDATGHPVGNVVAIAADADKDEHDPVVAALDDNTFVVGWIQDDPSGRKRLGYCRPTAGATKCLRYIIWDSAQPATKLAIATSGADAWAGWTTASTYLARRIHSDNSLDPQVVVAAAEQGQLLGEASLVHLRSGLVAVWTSANDLPRVFEGEIQAQAFTDEGTLLGHRVRFGNPLVAFQHSAAVVPGNGSRSALVLWTEVSKLASGGDDQLAWTEVLPGAEAAPVQRLESNAGTIIRAALAQRADSCQLVWLATSSRAEQIHQMLLPGCQAVQGQQLPASELDLTEGIRESLAATLTEDGLVVLEQLVARRGARWLRSGQPGAF
jgi:Leucine-rich repeat (LRR) protein